MIKRTGTVLAVALLILVASVGVVFMSSGYQPHTEQVGPR